MIRTAFLLMLAAVAALTTPASPPARKAAIPPAPAAVPAWTLRILSPPASSKYVIEGRVIGTDGKPRRDLRVHAHHADAAGNYSKVPDGPFLRAGDLRTSVLGQYRVETELPGMAEGNPHVHFLVEDPGVSFYAFSVNLARRAGAGSDPVFGRLPWMLVLPSSDYWAYVARGGDGVLHTTFDLRLAKGEAMRAPPEGWVGN